jgi:hypothetical protein
LNPNLKLNIKTKNRDIKMNLATAWLQFDKGILTFKAILRGIINAVEQDDELYTREAVLRSIYGFLYSEKNGLKKQLDD